MRFLKELFRPALKCSRLGHRPMIEVRRGKIKYPPDDGRYYGHGVAYLAKQSRTACRRCRAGLTEWETDPDSVEPIHSLTMPDSMWEKFNREGFI